MNGETFSSINSYRHYDPELGRFIQEDPNPGMLEIPGSVVNSYSYVLNNPANLSDPKGESPLLILLAFTLIQTALQAGAKNGSWWDNFRDSFDKPFSGGGHGQFWDNLVFNGIAMAFGFTPGMDLSTGAYLGASVFAADFDDQQKREGYKSNYLGFKVGQLYDGLKIYKAVNTSITIYEGYDDFRSWFGAYIPHMGRDFGGRL